MQEFRPQDIAQTQYLFFTGKGGVGKTTVASATAVYLAKSGYRVTLVSTDPASNLQDVFEVELTNEAQTLEELPLLKLANFNPDQAVEDYKESIVGPYRGVLPQEAIDNMEEQLSGSCTQEVATFNEFAFFLSDEETRKNNDYIIFDTAPTGHTLRMLELPSAWTTFFDENTTGTSCMGQLSGLTQERKRYQQALEVLNTPSMTTLLLVTRPQEAALAEAGRAAEELKDLGMQNQVLIVNGLLAEARDSVSEAYRKQQVDSLAKKPDSLKDYETSYIPLRPYNVTGLDKLSILLDEEQPLQELETYTDLEDHSCSFDQMLDHFIETGKQIIFTMGKGGVGKTLVATEIAEGLADKGKKVRLATTDPADHLHFYLKDAYDMEIDHIDEKEELHRYSEEVLSKARATMDDDQLDYLKEDLRSPCTQETAVFIAFSRIVDKASEDEIVVIDTAPTGHTLLLLESANNYSKEIQRSSGEIDPATERLLPRLQDPSQTEVVMVTLAEATPFYESYRLAKDLDRAQIPHDWWVINQSLVKTESSDPILASRASNEWEWIDKVEEESHGHFVLLEWDPHFQVQEVSPA